MNEFYTIGHVTRFTGLTDRTVRSHIASGFLEGEKLGGVWHFTPEQVEAYIAHPAVLPGIRARNNGIVYDFLLDNKKTEQQCCIVLDLPGDDREETSGFFCNAISTGDYSDLQFTYHAVAQSPRVILRGHTDQVLELVNRYYSHIGTGE